MKNKLQSYLVTIRDEASEGGIRQEVVYATSPNEAKKKVTVSKKSVIGVLPVMILHKKSNQPLTLKD